MNPDAIAPPVDSRRAKLAGRAAEQIIADVVELGWPVGQILGSEAELLERYGVSRAVLREAVRLVEHQHVARMRRGPGGGLVIDEPDIDAVISPAILYLLRVDATLDEVFDARDVLEELTAEIAAKQLDEADIAAIRQTLSEESAGTSPDYRLLHSRLAAMTHNPVLELFVEILNRVSLYYFSDAAALSPEIHLEVHRAHERIATAVLAGNPGLARERMRRHLEAEASFIRNQPATVQRLDASSAVAGAIGDKRAEALARNLFADIVETGKPPGAFIGSEAALMADYSASRAVLREAVRILEYHQIALMRRGPGGGLFVAAPDASAVTDIIAIYLRRRGVGPHHMSEVRTGLELAIVERVAARLKPEDADTIERSLDSESAVGFYRAFGEGQDFHSSLAALTGNRALELVHRVTMRLGWLFFSRFAEAAPAVLELSQPSKVEPAHRGVAEALLAGDKDLAVMRMRTHLAATSPSAK
ncbi:MULTISPECIES: FadR/GntR family transcriptional regulator [unclassified Mycobacterium]|uniref:FadR/GntR family transcriptional regulator n=1 Tax=unclassified Mycobacterium TaxID=2642494 RepID=UPI0029C6F94B|nr:MULTISPECIES: FCD domain-containing protein [unclassified Mycobacterium]